MEGRVRRRYRVRGVVQGVGFRPFVYATATRLALTGEVGNDSDGVVVEVEGAAGDVAELGRVLREDAPPLARVEAVTGEDVEPRGGTGFVIAESTRTGASRTLASPDVATCPDCLRELRDPADRRHRHPFVTCTSCGPRFTIIRELPYDRPATTMAAFPMCPRCAAEYADPADRRFHAQPIACPDCGPHLELLPVDGAIVRGDAAAVRAARAMLAGGKVLAVKGIGGYHLVCDATDDAAVSELRRRKRRGAKPFAVMVRDVETAESYVDMGGAERALLADPRRPIVLLQRRPDPAGAPLSDQIAPRNPDLGLLLPYSPLHELLLGLDGDEPDLGALVMTSGNLGGEPIAYDDADARARLASLVDGWLTHDRPIHVPCDDSVARVVGGVELPVRRSRGYAPLPLALPFPVPPTLAVGADLKNTFCLAAGRYAWLSQHVGDMDDLATLDAFTAAEAHLERLTGVAPTSLVADRHPSYRSSGWARDHAAGRQVRRVQHHHAHVTAVMGEHGLDGSERVIGVAFDGTGFGDDGAVWGGEVLVADYAGFARFAHLGYVPLPGGDAAVLRPYRMALAHLHAAGVEWADDLPPVEACPPEERAVLDHQLGTGLGCVQTSSLGRLFDAVASLAGLRHVVDFEAEAAAELEGRSRGVAVAPSEAYPLPLAPDLSGALVADPAPLVRAVVADVRGGLDAGVIGARFHAAVSRLVVDAAVAARERYGLGTVTLGGGVFQNALLLAATREMLAGQGFRVLWPRLLPPNDGGIALGQLLAAAWPGTAREEDR